MKKTELQLTGYVTSGGSPVSHARIRVAGTAIYCTSNRDGFFELFFKQLPITLKVKHPDYETKIVRVTDIQEKVVIELVEKAVTLEMVKSRIPQFKDSVPTSDPFVTFSQKINTRSSFGKRMFHNVSGGQGMTYGGGFPKVNREEYSVLNSNKFLATAKEKFSTFSIDVDTAAYSTVRRFLQQGQRPTKSAVRIEEMLNYFTYDYPQPTEKHPFELYTEVSDCPWNSQHRLVHIGLQGKNIPTEDLPPSNLVFLVDVSGSMNEAKKLPLLKSSLKLLVQQLRPQDKVAIVTYANNTKLVLNPTSGSNKQAITAAIDSLYGSGCTHAGQAIQQAYQLARDNFVQEGNNRIILASDGDFNVGITSEAELTKLIEQERKSGVYLTVLGFGMGNYKDNKLQVLATKGNGNHAYIDTLTEAKKVLVNEFGGTIHTIAKDVKIQVEFNPAHVQGYRLIGYEKRVMPPEDFRNDKKDAGELGVGHTVTALYEVIPTGIQSEWIHTIPDSKYQPKEEEVVVSPPSHLEELLTIKFRYKQPDGEIATEFEKVIVEQSIPIAAASDNFRWSVAIVAFGMLLKDSSFKGNTDLAMVIALAEGAIAEDKNGYRKECLNLMETCSVLLEPS